MASLLQGGGVMIPFYCVDGPLKGQTIEGDFRQHEYLEGREVVVYRKSTYGRILKIGGYDYRVFCDIAHVAENPPDQCPSEALANLTIETEEDAHAIRVTADMLGIVCNNGEIKLKALSNG
jgi:hypothetical protein